ncbi:MAG TPA: hypothetical protein VFU81_16565 [Thermomicrobiales bacterium]|nr:hypothetical protein [Thermomicrobiales bacterium]
MIDLSHLAAAIGVGRALGEVVYFVHATTPSGAKCCAEVRSAVTAGGGWVVLATSLATGRTLAVGGDAGSRAHDLIAALAAFFAEEDEADEGADDGTMRAE